MVKKILEFFSFPISKIKSLESIELKFALLKLGVIVFAVIAVYFQDLSLAYVDALQYEGQSYILLIPVLIAYLLYRKRRILAATVLNENKSRENRVHLPTLAGFLMCLIAFTIYVFGSQTFFPLQYHLVSLPIFVAGLILIFFNLTTLRQVIFPIIFLGFLTPPPVTFLNNIGSILSVGSTGVANTFANILGVKSWISIESGTPAINLIRPDNQPLLLIVDVACSGIYSLVGFAVFATFFAYIVRDKIWKKLAIVAIGFPLIYFLNIIRITALVLIGYQLGAELALDLFHLMGGWILVFLGTLFLLVIAEKGFKAQIFTKPKINPQENHIKKSNTKLFASLLITNLKESKNKFKVQNAVKIASVIIVTLLVVYIQSPVFSLTRGPAPLLVQTSVFGQQGNVDILPQIEDYRLRFVYRDTTFEELSGQDFSLAFAYYPDSPGDLEVNVAVEVAESTIPLHYWEVCLITWAIPKGDQPVTSLDLRDIRIQEDPPIIARYFAFQEQDQPQIQLVLYYFTTSIFEIENTTQKKQVKLSFITYFEDPKDLPAKEKELLTFAEKTVAYWEPLRKWNTVTTAISQNIMPLEATATAGLIALLPVSWIQTRKRHKINASILRKLHPDDQKIIEAVQETEKKKLATIENITENLSDSTTKPVNKDKLLNKLYELEELGVMRTKIINEQDNAVYTWKALL